MCLQTKTKGQRITFILIVVLIAATLLFVSSLPIGYRDTGFEGRAASPYDVYLIQLYALNKVVFYEAPGSAEQQYDRQLTWLLSQFIAYTVFLAWLTTLYGRKRLEALFQQDFSLQKRVTVPFIALSIGGHAPPVCSRKSCNRTNCIR